MERHVYAQLPHGRSEENLVSLLAPLWTSLGDDFGAKVAKLTKKVTLEASRSKFSQEQR